MACRWIVNRYNTRAFKRVKCAGFPLFNTHVALKLSRRSYLYVRVRILCAL